VEAKAPLTILTLVPTAYVTVRVYLHTRDLGLAVGAGVVSPLAIYWIFDAWLEGASWWVRTSWARWWANRSDERPLLIAAVAAAIFIGIFTLIWFAVSTVTDY
jgi:hypothetical protein